MQDHEHRIIDLEAQVRALSERLNAQDSRVDLERRDAEKQRKEAEHRVSDIDHEVRRLDRARETISGQIRDLFLGRTEDAKYLVLSLAVLGVVSLIEAIAIIVLWVRR